MGQCSAWPLESRALLLQWLLSSALLYISQLGSPSQVPSLAPAVSQPLSPVQVERESLGAAWGGSYTRDGTRMGAELGLGST